MQTETTWTEQDQEDGNAVLVTFEAPVTVDIAELLAGFYDVPLSAVDVYDDQSAYVSFC
jgi:hypothetical protein